MTVVIVSHLDTTSISYTVLTVSCPCDLPHEAELANFNSEAVSSVQ